MGLILNIDTATPVCSVALAKEGSVIALRESHSSNEHSSVLTTFIEAVCKEAGITLSALDAVSVSMGPGSYTGLRIGVATAKGLCYSLDKPFIAVPTLLAMAGGMKEAVSRRDGSTGYDISTLLFCPMIDARRMEVYMAIYDGNLNEVRDTRAEIITDEFTNGLDPGRKIVFAGDGALKCRSILGVHPSAVFVDGFSASAAFMAPFSEKRYNAGQFENTAYFEPFYLKDFIAGKPRVKGLR
jgi:tRNA threonylcarbamoyladenosine biosynthesis protein TsaB